MGEDAGLSTPRGVAALSICISPVESEGSEQPVRTTVRDPLGKDYRSEAAEHGEQFAQAKIRRQISHDIRHELSTIMMLADVLSGDPQMSEQARGRAQQILGETRWLHQLLQAYDQGLAGGDSSDMAQVEPIRLDAVAAEVVAPIQLSTRTRVIVRERQAWARVDKLGLWRALRNLVVNAVRAAGPDGAVEIRIEVLAGWAVIEVEDDGPGFDSEQPRTSSLGLGIVQQLVSAWGGELEINRGNLGGCCVRLLLPNAGDGQRSTGAGA
jgi:signal transduction histidine kinase